MRGEFVDSNVLVYAHDASAGDKRDRCVQLLERLLEEQAGRLSTQVLMEFVVVVTRKIPRPLSLPAAAEIVEDFGAWPVFSPRVADITEAAGVAQRYRIHFWDAMIVVAAKAHGAGLLWSEDLNHGQEYEGVRVVNPFVD